MSFIVMKLISGHMRYSISFSPIKQRVGKTQNASQLELPGMLEVFSLQDLSLFSQISETYRQKLSSLSIKNGELWKISLRKSKTAFISIRLIAQLSLKTLREWR